MFKPVPVLLISAMVLTSCGVVRDSRLNPMNWFGRSQPVAATGAEEVNPLIPRRRGFFQRGPEEYSGTPIATVTDVVAEPLPGGAILRATGVANRLGPYDARLRLNEEASDATTLVFTFDVRTPSRAPATGPERVRTVNVAKHLSDKELDGIRNIRVIGANGARVIRRR